jgi:opine dehydrogenase
MALATIASIGRQIGVPTPRIDAIVNVACMANGEDYWQTGRTVGKMGLVRNDPEADGTLFSYR